PANQVEKWLDVYSNRFINPVYRLFQSELETVYEEYNMYKDNRSSTAFEIYSKAFYPDHPYGVPIIGYPGHLKNPSMKKMNEYFETYYVANNMALVLSGNFNPDEVKPMISRYFGGWRSGEIPPMPADYTIQPLTGRNLVQEKLTPVRFGILSYRSVPLGNKDEPVLDVINGLLSNQSQTGLIDELVVDNKLMQAGATGMRYIEAGGEMVFFIPKIIGQSLKKAENLVNDQLENLKAGNFDEELLEAVKTDIIVNYERNFEDQYSRGYMMIMAFVKERDWQKILGYPDKIKIITKEDVVKAAQKYYTGNELVFYSKTGFPKKPKTLKSPFDPIPSSKTEMKSEYAKKIENMPVPETEPDFIEFGPPGNKSNEVTITGLNKLTHLYYTEVGCRSYLFSEA
ncbi:MAG: pitrilysin family protein, partial [Bacteroidales bacterium]